MGLPILSVKALLCDKVSKVCGDVLQENGIETSYPETKEELLRQIESAAIMVIRSATKITPELLDKAHNLKLVVRAGTGYDNVNVEECSKRGILVMNTPMANTISAAEHTCGLIMALSRHVPQAAKSMEEGRWDRKKYMGNELYGKTLGVVGLGRIGREVAIRMQVFGMKTVGFDPIVSEEDALKYNITKLSLEEMLSQSDYVTVHTPLIPQTRHMINKETLLLCPKGVKVVNCARGGIIDEDELLVSLESGQCGGAALDVFEQEPPTNTALTQHEKVICTPHLGASTNEAQKRCGEDAANQIVEFVKGISYTGAVNGFSIVNALNPSTKPWISLALNLGIIVGKYIEEFLSKFSSDINLAISLKGCGLNQSKNSITDALCAGVLKHKYKAVNLVNSRKFFEEAKMKVQMDYEENSISPQLEVNIVLKGEPVWGIGGMCQGSYPVLTYIGKSLLFSPPLLKSFLLLFQFNGETNMMEKLAHHLNQGASSISSIIMPDSKTGENWGVVASNQKINVSEWKNAFHMCFPVSLLPISDTLPLQMV